MDSGGGAEHPRWVTLDVAAGVVGDGEHQQPGVSYSAIDSDRRAASANHRRNEREFGGVIRVARADLPGKDLLLSLFVAAALPGDEGTILGCAAPISNESRNTPGSVGGFFSLYRNSGASTEGALLANWFGTSGRRPFNRRLWFLNLHLVVRPTPRKFHEGNVTKHSSDTPNVRSCFSCVSPVFMFLYRAL